MTGHVLAAVAALMCAACAWLGYALCDWLVARRQAQVYGDAGPVLLVLLGGLTGAVLGARGMDPLHLLGLSLVVVCLVALVRCELRAHWSPPWLSLVPLGCICAVAIAQRAFWVPASAVLVSLPFASIALATKGQGASWGDVRTAALGTSLIGLFPAIVVFAAATLLSAFIQWGLRRRESIQLAPYLVGATAIAAIVF